MGLVLGLGSVVAVVAAVVVVVVVVVVVDEVILDSFRSISSVNRQSTITGDRESSPWLMRIPEMGE